MTQYLATLHKWGTLKNGPLAQRLPTYIPGREFLSPSRAHSLKVPFTKKEALVKLACLEGILKDEWIRDASKFKQQQEAVLGLLALGAYSLPGMCLTSFRLDVHLRDVMEKELNKCMKELRNHIRYGTVILANMFDMTVTTLLVEIQCFGNYDGMSE